MVNEIEKLDEECYKCEICNFIYRDKKLAEKCEAWCGEHNSCNLDITKHAIR